MNRWLPSLAPALLLLVGVVWFGLRLGPQEKKREATPESAIFAAQGFVRTMLTRGGGHNGHSSHNGTLREEIIFPASGSASVAAVQDTTDRDLWVVTGTAKVGAADLHWLVREHWDGVNRWRPKAVDVVGPKRSKDQQ